MKHASKNMFGFRCRLAVALFVAECIAASLSAQTSRVQTTEATQLEVGKTIEGQLAGGQSHEYDFTLQAGQYARLSVKQLTINVAVAVFAPDGAQVFVADAYALGVPEPVELIADAAGTYRLRVTAPEPKAPLGRYEVRVVEVVIATERHKSRVAATLAIAAMPFSVLQTREARLEAIGHFEVALAHWRAAEDLAEEARTLYSIGSLYTGIGDQQKALEYTLKSLPVAQASHERLFEAWALYSIGLVYDRFNDKKKAVEYYDQALPLMRATNDQNGEGNVLLALGASYLRLGEKRRAVDHFEQATRIFEDVQNRYMMATAVNNIGVAMSDLGDYQRALERHQESLVLRRELNWPDGEALTLSNVGLVYLRLGEYQKALDALREALDINRSLGNRWNSGVNMNNIGRVYGSLGDRQRALQFFEDALEILREVKDQWGLAHTLNYTGEIYADSGDYQKSLTFHNEALSFARAVGDLDQEAAALNNIGNAWAKLGDREKARDQFEQALAIHRKAGKKQLLAGTLRNLGALHGAVGNYQRAMEYLNEALEISRATHDRNIEAATLSDLARVERDGGNFSTARLRAEEALSAFEQLRLSVLSPQLKASLFASTRQIHELNLQVLMRLHVERPKEGFSAEALRASERGRARSLLELLAESGTEIRRDVDAALLNRERELERLISAKAEQQTRLLNELHTDADAAAASKELDTLTTDLEQVQSRIREASPQYAALTQPVPLDLKDIQKKVLDADTVLLEYSLGAEKSFLWAVTPASLEVFELPPRAEVESVSKRVYDLLTSRNLKPENETALARAARLRKSDTEFSAAAAKASRILLGPAASIIQDKRLLIVGEGVLQYLPFAALPEPSPNSSETSDKTPLIVKHEIVMAPSASVLAVLRQETQDRKPAEKALAVVADPVFTAGDGRITVPKESVATARADLGGQEFVRLRFSRSEAEAISRLAPPTGTLKALDFDASRETVLSPDFGRYRILHFATHSLINNERPELSGVVLSLFDASGHPQNGVLRLYDIYNLRLASDLVVLSACQTALGGEIRSEGLIGLTRGFLYAGAPRVAATLWAIDDRTTAELMKRFYEGMLVRGERPAAALRAAQIATWKTRGWEAPYYWAAFILQGEWR